MACKEQGKEGEKRRSSITCPLASKRGRP